MKQKAIVTGANGFIGCNLVKALIAKHYDVTCLVRKTSNVETLKNLPVKFICWNEINDKILFENQDYIFHLAAKVKAKNKRKYFEANLERTKILISVLKNSNLKKFIFVSSQSAAGPCKTKIPKTEKDTENPISHYGKSKLAAENFIKDNCKIPWTIIRPSGVFGPYDKDFLIYFKLIKKGIAPLVGFGEKFFSLIFIDDLTDLIIKSAENPKANFQTFFACDGKIYSQKDFIKSIEKAMQKKSIKINIPIISIFKLAIFNEMLKFFCKNQFTLNFQKAKEMREKYWICSSEKSEKILNFNLKFSLDEAIEKTYNWYKKNKWL
ncbi:MAG: NAD(P)-dependent oxidoreductase [Candidatus Cloacimonetes bacterium]|nr:NAD(P)-dependent oxidoreductase [Candidatus Cloacimonadota bacterium]